MYDDHCPVGEDLVNLDVGVVQGVCVGSLNKFIKSKNVSNTWWCYGGGSFG